VVMTPTRELGLGYCFFLSSAFFGGAATVLYDLLLRLIPTLFSTVTPVT
jgi:hypothetical protein